MSACEGGSCPQANRANSRSMCLRTMASKSTDCPARHMLPPGVARVELERSTAISPIPSRRDQPWSPTPIGVDDGDLAASSGSTGAKHRSVARRTGPAASMPLGEAWRKGARCALAEIDEVGGNGGLVPLQTNTGEIRHLDPTRLDVVGLLQQGISPILPFQPMRRLSNAHDVRRNFGIKVRRHGYPGGTANGGGAEPAGDAADAHEIRHYQIARLALQRLVQVPGSIEVFADLNGCFKFGRKPGIAVEVVVDDRLLDPGKTEVVDGVAALQSFGEIEALVEVDHQIDIVADGPSNRGDGREVFSPAIAPEAKLEATKPTFVSELDRFLRDGRRCLQPQAVAVVAANGADRATEQDAERHLCGPRQGIPGRHVEAGNGNCRQTFIADEV